MTFIQNFARETRSVRADPVTVRRRETSKPISWLSASHVFSKKHRRNACMWHFCTLTHNCSNNSSFYVTNGAQKINNSLAITGESIVQFVLYFLKCNSSKKYVNNFFSLKNSIKFFFFLSLITGKWAITTGVPRSSGNCCRPWGPPSRACSSTSTHTSGTFTEDSIDCTSSSRGFSNTAVEFSMQMWVFLKIIINQELYLEAKKWIWKMIYCKILRFIWLQQIVASEYNKFYLLTHTYMY